MPAARVGTIELTLPTLMGLLAWPFELSRSQCVCMLPVAYPSRLLDPTEGMDRHESCVTLGTSWAGLSTSRPCTCRFCYKLAILNGHLASACGSAVARCHDLLPVYTLRAA